MKYIDNSSIRRKDRILDDETIMNLIKTNEYGTLSMVETIDNTQTEKKYRGYGIPLNYVYDENENCLYFHGAIEGKKIDLLKQNSLVTFSIVGNVEVLVEQISTIYQSVLIEGEILLPIEGDEKRIALLKLIAKHSKTSLDKVEQQFGKMINSGMDKVVVMKLMISKISGKARN